MFMIDNHSHLRLNRVRRFLTMYVCICNAVTDADIRREAERGVRGFAQLQERTGCSTCCGCCEDEARRTLQRAIPAGQAQPFVNAA
jgi:bacterioferritin-associated ferredoxin